MSERDELESDRQARLIAELKQQIEELKRRVEDHERRLIGHAL